MPFIVFFLHWFCRRVQFYTSYIIYTLNTITNFCIFTQHSTDFHQSTEHCCPACMFVTLTTTASAVVPSALMTAGALLMTAAVRGVWMLLTSCANSGCFFLMCWTILVWRYKHRALSDWIRIVNELMFVELLLWQSSMPTLLLYCLAQCGQQTGAVAMVPVSCVWVLSMGSGSPGAAGRSFRMLGGSSAPGWFFSMCAFLLLALLYTCTQRSTRLIYWHTERSHSEFEVKRKFALLVLGMQLN